MCGICGVYSTQLQTPERELFEGMLMLNVWRGKDSTGVVRINAPKSKAIASIKRMVAPSPAFITSRAGNEFLWDLDKKEAKDHSSTIGYIGHCRAATKGDVKIQNAHPFRFDHIIGVHNGTIKYPFEGSKEFETDSEAFFALVNDMGIEKALNAIAHADPAYAFVYVDTKEKTLNFVRNYQRPLNFTYIFAKSTLLYSSKSEMIEFPLSMRGTNIPKSGWDAQTSNNGYFSLKENHLLTIPLGESPAKAEIRELKVEKKKSYSVVNPNYGNGGWGGWGYYDSEGSLDGYGNFREIHGAEDLSALPWLDDEQKESSKAGEAGKETSSSGGDKGTTKALTPANDHPQHKANQHGGEPVSQSERNFRLAQGCFCCGTSVSPNDYGQASRVRWWNREHFACGDCYENTSGDTDWVALAIDGEVPSEVSTDKKRSIH